MEYIPKVLLSALTPIGLTAAYIALRTWLPNHRGAQVHTAILFGLAMWVTLVTTVMYAPGVIADMRGTVLTLAVLFGGPVPALVALAVGVVMRFWIGGIGVVIGIAALLVTYAGLQVLPRCLPVYFPAKAPMSGVGLVASGLWTTFTQLGALLLADMASGVAAIDVAMPLAQFLVTTVAGSLFIVTQQRSNLRQNLNVQREQVRSMKIRDAVTGFLNREGFTWELDVALLRRPQSASKLAVVTVGMPRLRKISETLGQHTADALLEVVAYRLRILADLPSLARLDGDTFCFFLDNVGDHTIPRLAEELFAAFHRPITLDGQDFYITVNIGMSTSPSDGTTADELVTHSSQALDSASMRGENLLQFYSHNLGDTAVRRLRLESALQKALDRTTELHLVYQPQVRLDTGALVGVEALCRWESPEFGTVTPSEFIPIAETSSLIQTLGIWSLKEVCRQITNWQQQGWRAPVVAVNLSAKQLLDQDFPEQALRCIQQHGHAPSLIQFELTESAVMTDPHQSQAVLGRLKGHGFGLALDDFGTGYSNMAYLKKLPFDSLKIDRSFVKDLEHDSDSRSLCGGISALGSSLHLTMLAEGVETEGQRKILADMGYQFAQGFYFSPPLFPVDLASHWLMKPASPPACAPTPMTGDKASFLLLR